MLENGGAVACIVVFFFLILLLCAGTGWSNYRTYNQCKRSFMQSSNSSSSTSTELTNVHSTGHSTDSSNKICTITGGHNNLFMFSGKDGTNTAFPNSVSRPGSPYLCRNETGKTCEELNTELVNNMNHEPSNEGFPTDLDPSKNHFFVQGKPSNTSVQTFNDWCCGNTCPKYEKCYSNYSTNEYACKKFVVVDSKGNCSEKLPDCTPDAVTAWTITDGPPP